jgi:hypothetical protein
LNIIKSCAARKSWAIRMSICMVVALAAALTVAPAQAADPTFPTGSLIGLVPPDGMTMSKGFLGFEDLDKEAAILLAAQPPAALPEIQKSLTTDSLRKQGINVEQRDEVQLSFGKGSLVIGKQEADKKRYRKWLLVAPANDLTALVNIQIPEQANAYPDAVLRAALLTLAVRASVPDTEKLSLLPFTVGDLAGLHIQSVLPGRAVMLIDTPDGKPTGGVDSHLFVAAFPGGPAESADRNEFARLAFAEIVGIKDVQINMSEPLRLGGQSGYQTMAQAKDVRSNADVMVAQWLRFGSGGFLQMIGIARTDAWTDALARFRTVRDSIDPR